MTYTLKIILVYLLFLNMYFSHVCTDLHVLVFRCIRTLDTYYCHRDWTWTWTSISEFISWVISSNSSNKLGQKFAKDKGVIGKMETNGTGNCFITLKDHKENSVNNPNTRLLNPAKNEIGRISKDILDNINKELRTILQLNQWKNTKDVISWFKEIPNKSRCKFVVFDVKDSYSSIKEP